MFRRKPKPEVRITPEIPKFISREAMLLEMLEADRREHEGNIKICNDLKNMRITLQMAVKEMMDITSRCLAVIDVADKQIGIMIDCLQGDKPDLQSVISSNPMPNGSAEEKVEEGGTVTGQYYPIGFTANHG